MTTTPQPGDPVEVVPAVIEEASLAAALDRGLVPAPANAAVVPTQVRRPWRSMARTAVQMSFALLSLAPFVAAGVYQDADAYPAAVVQVLGVSAAVTRVMALPQVESFLRRFKLTSWVAAAPAPTGDNR